MKISFLITLSLFLLSSCGQDTNTYNLSKVSKQTDGQQDIKPAKIETISTENVPIRPFLTK